MLDHQTFCSRCGARSEADSNYCESCGAPLVEDRPSPRATVPPPPAAALTAPPPPRAVPRQPAPSAPLSEPPPAPPSAPPAPPSAPPAPPTTPAPARRSRRWLGVLGLLAVVAGAAALGLPRYATYLRDRAEAALAQGKPEVALAATSWATRLGFGRSPRLYAARGRALAGLGRHDEAFAAFHEAGARSSASDEARFIDMEGHVIEQKGDVATAIRYYGESIRVDPGAPAWLLDRARAHARLGASAQAAADYRAALRLDPTNAAAVSGLRELGARPAPPSQPQPTPIGPYGTGPAPVSAGGSESGAENLTPGAVGDEVDMVDTYLAFADTLTARGDWVAAEAVYRRAVAAQPASARAYAGLAGALLRLGRRPEAVAAAREALRLGHPRDAAVFRELGM